ncbi:MAG: ATP-binding protein [Candidatus Pacebacteria bacterium]|nr:ATP-binding protein [Candidatus Paceibacterota bacterium]MDD5535117.1 ATP-binding protein [Candidatus Paceibacterota bacterium]
MFKFFQKLRKHFFSSQLLVFWFFGGILITQIVFNFFWVDWPLNLIISLGLSAFYSVIGIILLNAVDSAERLNMERNQINAIIGSIDDPAISYGQNFEIVLVNGAMEKFLGLNKKELIGKIITPELSNDPHYGVLTKLIFPSLAPMVLEKTVDTYPEKIKIKFFQPRESILEIVTTKVIDEKGKTYGFLRIIHDLTKEEMLKKTQSDFITIVAHQLRTPMSGLAWILEILANEETGSLTAEQEKLLNDGQKALKESLKTVEDLLNVAQIEEGRFGFQFIISDLEKIIEETLTKFEPVAQKDNIKLIFHRPSFGLKPFVMDPLRIKLVLEILVDNAVKYNVKNGEIRIRIDPMDDKPFILISVEDTGVGISPEDLQRLFTKFFRSQAALKDQTSGIGLGLYLAKNIIERHGGKIWVKSALKRGSLFTFSLPIDPDYIPSQ